MATIMDNKVQRINSHFIHKAFPKNYCNLGILKFSYFEPYSREVNVKTFKVSVKVTVVHPIVKKYFYSHVLVLVMY